MTFQWQGLYQHWQLLLTRLSHHLPGVLRNAKLQAHDVAGHLAGHLADGSISGNPGAAHLQLHPGLATGHADAPQQSEGAKV